MKKEIKIATILRPHGIKGGLKISPNLDDIPFSNFSTVMVGKNMEVMHVKRILPLNQFLVLELKEIDSCDKAELYRNQSIYVSREDYPSLLEDVVMMSDYIGCEVINEKGESVGVVVEATNYGSADIISINCGGTTYMVPFIKDTLSFDKEKGIFIIDSKRFLEVRV